MGRSYDKTGKDIITVSSVDPMGCDTTYYVDILDKLVCPICPSFAGVKPKVTVTDNQCDVSSCTLSGGAITAPTCPSGSSVEYRVTQNGVTSAWTTTKPVYDDVVPMEIRTRCTCDSDKTMLSSEGAPVLTNPVKCQKTATPAETGFTICSSESIPAVYSDVQWYDTETSTSPVSAPDNTQDLKNKTYWITRTETGKCESDRKKIMLTIISLNAPTKLNITNPSECAISDGSIEIDTSATDLLYFLVGGGGNFQSSKVFDNRPVGKDTIVVQKGGCYDSIIVGLRSTQTEKIDTTICDEGFSLIVGGRQFDSSNPKDKFTRSSTFCDTIYDVKLNFQSQPEVMHTDSICPGETTQSYKERTYSSIGKDTFELTTMNDGCDTIYIVDIVEKQNCSCLNPTDLRVLYDNRICLGDTLRLEAISQRAQNIRWFIKDGDGIYKSDTSRVNYYVPGVMDSSNASFVLIAETDDPDGAGPCTSVQIELTVVIDNIVQTEFELESTICESSFVPFLLPKTSKNNVAGSWYPDSVTAAGKYWFTPNYGQCATDTAIVFKLLMGEVLMYTDSICAGETVTYRGVNYTTVIKDTLMLRSTTGGCDTTAYVDIVEKKNCSCVSPPSISFIHKDKICEADSFELYVTVSNTKQYNWINEGDGKIYQITEDTFRYRPGVSDIDNGFVKLMVETIDPDSDGPCNAATFEETIVFVKKRTQKFTLDSTICKNSVSSFALPDTSMTGVEGQWEPSTVTSSGVYRFVPDVGECASETTVNITVNDLVKRSFVDSLCAGETVLYRGKTYTSAINDTLMVPGGGGSCDSIIYVDIVQKQICGCSNPVMITNTKKIVKCGENMATILITASGINLEYSIDNGQTWQDSSTFSNIMSGVYDVVVRQRDDISCTDNVQLDLPYFPYPVIDSVEISNATTCTAQDGFITISATGDQLEYSTDSLNWSSNNTISGLSATSDSMTVWVRKFNPPVCITDQKVIIKADPVSISYQDSLCAGETVLYRGKAYASVGKDTVLFNTEGSVCDTLVYVDIVQKVDCGCTTTSITLDSTLCDMSYELMVGGTTFDLDNPTGQVTLTGATGECDTVYTINLQYKPLVVDFDAYAVPQATDTFYVIEIKDVNNGQETYVIKADTATLNNVSDAGFPYKLNVSKLTGQLTVTDANNCEAQATFSIKIADTESPREIIIPNIFSPQSTEGNETFYATIPTGSDDKIASMHIFDRWGDSIYLSEDESYLSDKGGWNGKIANVGEWGTQSVYVYLIKVKKSDGTIKNYVGDVTLLLK